MSVGFQSLTLVQNQTFKFASSYLVVRHGSYQGIVLAVYSGDQMGAPLAYEQIPVTLCTHKVCDRSGKCIHLTRGGWIGLSIQPNDHLESCFDMVQSHHALCACKSELLVSLPATSPSQSLTYHMIVCFC